MQDRDLTPRQLEILDVIRREQHKRGFPPSIREIGERVGLSSSSTVHNHLRQLEVKGYIRRDPSRPRCIEVLDAVAAPPVVTAESQPQSMPAGVRLYPVLENAVSPSLEPVTVPLPRELVGADNAFLFQVEGDSMRDAAILHGDLVIAERTETAEDGDIVVALVNSEITVKRYFRGNGAVRLEPDNRRMKPIFVKDARVLGKVVGLIRRIY